MILQSGWIARKETFGLSQCGGSSANLYWVVTKSKRRAYWMKNLRGCALFLLLRYHCRTIQISTDFHFSIQFCVMQLCSFKMILGFWVFESSRECMVSLRFWSLVWLVCCWYELQPTSSLCSSNWILIKGFFLWMDEIGSENFRMLVNLIVATYLLF